MLLDDHAVVRHALAGLLNVQDDIEVVAQGEDGGEALRLYREHLPDVTLLDVRMPQVGGVEALSLILAEFPNARILMLTTSDVEQDFFTCLDVGACGYLLKTSHEDELIAAIRLVSEGKTYLSPVMRARLDARPLQKMLTAREAEVLDLLRRGLSNRDIGMALGVSENTAKAHVRRLLAKLEAADRTEAVAQGFQRGLLTLDG